jgi:hypothetical protein
MERLMKLKVEVLEVLKLASRNPLCFGEGSLQTSLGFCHSERSAAESKNLNADKRSFLRQDDKQCDNLYVLDCFVPRNDEWIATHNFKKL